MPASATSKKSIKVNAPTALKGRVEKAKADKAAKIIKRHQKIVAAANKGRKSGEAGEAHEARAVGDAPTLRKPTLVRLFRRGGVECVKGNAYNELRKDVLEFVRDVLKNSICFRLGRTKRIGLEHIRSSLLKHGIAFYGDAYYPKASNRVSSGRR